MKSRDLCVSGLVLFILSNMILVAISVFKIGAVNCEMLCNTRTTRKKRDLMFFHRSHPIVHSSATPKTWALAMDAQVYPHWRQQCGTS
jgi:hypothetical protein